MAQAGRRWQRSLFPWLLDQGFTQHDADECAFSIMATTDDRIPPANVRKSSYWVATLTISSRRTPTTTSSRSTTRPPPPYSHPGTSRTRVR
eukprot:1063955-Prymnesium_polylepis.1